MRGRANGRTNRMPAFEILNLAFDPRPFFAVVLETASEIFLVLSSNLLLYYIFTSFEILKDFFVHR